MAYARIDRISEEVKKELSFIIKNDLKDPRLSEIITLVSVKVTKDLKFAKIFVSVLGDEKAKEETLIALKSAAGFIRREIGGRLQLRNAPEFIFEIDNTLDHAMHIEELINGINKTKED